MPEPETDAPADEELMLAYKNGDAVAFATLYQRHKGSLYRYMLRQCASRAVAEELFQDVWMSMIRARKRYRPSAKFSTYLFRVAHNRLIDHYRKNNTTQTGENPDQMASDPDEQPGSPQQQPEQQTFIQQQIRHLLTCIQALPLAQRQAFLLKEETGLGLDEIARIMDANPEAAKSRLRYAIKKLRQCMGEYL
jgi:RNA polymerase sigma-70 factor (ECF subfamily)